MMASMGMMFCVMTNLFGNLMGFFVGYINSLVVANILMVLLTMLSVFMVANLRHVFVMIIVTTTFGVAVMMFHFLMANLKNSKYT